MERLMIFIHQKDLNLKTMNNTRVVLIFSKIKQIRICRDKNVNQRYM